MAYDETDIERMARVTSVDGELVLIDPDAEAVVEAVNTYNSTRQLLDLNKDRIDHFRNRVAELGHTPADVVVTVINVDDSVGAILAEELMPGHDWQAFRDRGELPVARGLAGRIGVQGFLEVAYGTVVSEQLDSLAGLAVVVIDNGCAGIYPAQEI